MVRITLSMVFFKRILIHYGVPCNRCLRVRILIIVLIFILVIIIQNIIFLSIIEDQLSLCWSLLRLRCWPTFYSLASLFGHKNIVVIFNLVNNRRSNFVAFISSRFVILRYIIAKQVQPFLVQFHILIIWKLNLRRVNLG